MSSQEKKTLLTHESRQGFFYSASTEINTPTKIKVKGDDGAQFTLTTELYDPTDRQWKQVLSTQERVHLCDTFGLVRFGLNVPIRVALGIVEVENG